MANEINYNNFKPRINGSLLSHYANYDVIFVGRVSKVNDNNTVEFKSSDNCDVLVTMHDVQNISLNNVYEIVGTVTEDGSGIVQSEGSVAIQFTEDKDHEFDMENYDKMVNLCLYNYPNLFMPPSE
jgi:hypothetical protein